MTSNRLSECSFGNSLPASPKSSPLSELSITPPQSPPTLRRGTRLRKKPSNYLNDILLRSENAFYYADDEIHTARCVSLKCKVLREDDRNEEGQYFSENEEEMSSNDSLRHFVVDDDHEDDMIEGQELTCDRVHSEKEISESESFLDSDSESDSDNCAVSDEIYSDQSDNSLSFDISRDTLSDVIDKVTTTIAK